MQFSEGFVKNIETILGDEARAFLPLLMISRFCFSCESQRSQVSFQTLFKYLGAMVGFWKVSRACNWSELQSIAAQMVAQVAHQLLA